VSQHDFVVDNGTGSAVRTDLQTALQALTTLNSGPSAPGTTYAEQLWLDTSAGQWVLQVRNAANTAWRLLVAIGDDGNDTDFTVNIPSDFATLQAAVDTLAPVGHYLGRRILLNIETGHALTAGLIVENGDYSAFKIISVDATVPLDAGFVGVNTLDTVTNNTRKTLILGVSAQMPELGCIIDCAAGDCHNGYFAFYNSIGWLSRPSAPSSETPASGPIAGVKNTTGFNIRSRELSQVYAENTVGSGATINNYYANRGALIHCEFSDATGAGQYGVCANRNSVVVADSVDASSCVGTGFRALRGGKINAETSIATGCGVGYLATIGGEIMANGGDGSDAVVTGVETAYRGSGAVADRVSTIEFFGGAADDCALNGVWAQGCSRIDAVNVSANNAGSAGFRADTSSMDCEGSNANAATDNAYVCQNNSDMNMKSATSTSATVSSLKCRFGSRANATSATLNGATDHSIFCTNGSTVEASSSDVSGAPGDNIRVNDGGIIVITDATTRSAEPNAPNILDANIAAFNALTKDGVIFDGT